MSIPNIDRFNAPKDMALALTDLLRVAGQSKAQLADATLVRTGYMLEQIVVEMEEIVDVTVAPPA